MILIRVTHPKDTSIYKECEFESVDAAKKFLLESVAFYRVAAQQSVHPTVLESPQKSITCQPYGCVDYDGTPASHSG